MRTDTLPAVATEAEPLVFKVATELWELEQVHRLNYATFVEEIPQHAPNDRRALVDRFHRENMYLICLSGRELLGMVCVRDARPFSLEQKVAGLWSYLPPARRVCEIRLLAARADRRRGRIFPGLARALSEYSLERGYDLAIISATTRQLKLYEHMGFKPFGPPIGTPQAPFQPMYLTLENFHGTTLRLGSLGFDRGERQPVNFLPGPAPVSEAVWKAFSSPPVSHRSRAFIEEFQDTRELACRLAGARHVQLLMGSGTVANDAVAGQLQSFRGRGLIASNGEFGQRLIDAARRFDLPFDVVESSWGQRHELARVERAIQKRSPKWLWCVHCETSTGVLNDLPGLRGLCDDHDVRLCVDCISSIGCLPLDLSGVCQATASSGKGIAAMAGIAMVFHRDPIRPNPSLPRYLDLALYAEQQGVPFTFSSNLLAALKAALQEADPAARLAQASSMSRELRRGLREIGLRTVAKAADSSPAVTTIEIPTPTTSCEIGARLGRLGFLVGYESDYLLKRNWLQVSLMGKRNEAEIGHLLDALRAVAMPGGNHLSEPSCPDE